MARIKTLCAVIAVSAAASSCGSYVPDKDLFGTDTRISDSHSAIFGQSSEGRAEADLVGNIRCEIQNGVYLTSLVKNENRNNTAYLSSSWGTQVTLKLTWDETSSLAPGISFIQPMSSMQSRSIGLGGSVSSHATRVETVTFLFSNAELLKSEIADIDASHTKDLPNCNRGETGTVIDSNLKIADFLVDKATLATLGIASTDAAGSSPFSTFQEDLTFVASFGGNVTPTWKLTRLTANTSGNLLAGTRTATGDVLITLGPLAKDDHGNLLHKLDEPAASQHTAGIGAGSTATQINSQTH